MKPLSETELKAIHDRCEAATEGPWDYGWGSRKVGGEKRDWAVWKGGLTANLDNDSNNEPDTCFIANARTDIPALLNHIEYLRHENHVISKQQNVKCYVRAKELLESAQDLSAQAYQAITTWDREKAQWVGVSQQAAVDLARLHLGTILKTLEAYTDNWREKLIEKESEIARLKALTQWQPMDTAPKKLGPVLIAGGMKHEIHRCYGPVPLIGVVEAYYYPSTAYPNYDYEATDDTDTVRYAPTHWQPLPQPPEVTP